MYKGILVNAPFRNWVKISDTLATHAKHRYHFHSMQKADTLKAAVNKPDTRVDVMVSTALQDRLATNKHNFYKRWYVPYFFGQNKVIILKKVCERQQHSEASQRAPLLNVCIKGG